MSEKQGLEEDHRRLGRGPDEGMTWRDHPCVAPARLGRDFAVTLEDDDVVTVFLKLIRGGDADDPAAQDDYPHDVTALPVLGDFQTPGWMNQDTPASPSRHRANSGGHVLVCTSRPEVRVPRSSGHGRSAPEAADSS